MILLTSVDRRFSRDDLRQVGIVEVLTKPIRRQDLLRVILRAAASSPLAVLSMARESSSLARSDGLAASNTLSGAHALPPLRILVAEDNVVNQRVIQLQLKKLGCTAEIAANGWEVLEALERSSYDVVLMDCQMPEMDGYEATRRIRQMPRLANMRVIAMTAHAMQGDRELCLAAGMDDYLSKPTRVEDVKAALARSVAAVAGHAA
jgi:CheY-like chemotaxis protein